MKRLGAVIACLAAGCGSSSPSPSHDGGSHDGGSHDGGSLDARPATPADAGEYLTPNPLISRGKPVYGQSAVAFSMPANVNDGVYHDDNWAAGTPSTAAPAWVAIQVGAGPKRVLLSWNAGGSYDYLETDYGSPADYHLDVSADSTNGADGTWTTVASITANTVRTRAHAFDFTGMSWVKMVVTAAPAVSPNGVQLDEIDVHDISNGANDTWFFMGDSITAFAYDRAPADQPSYAEDIDAKHAAYFPAMINGGIGGETSADGVTHLADWIALNPDYHYFAVGYGTNDSAGNNSDTATFQSNMQMIIDGLLAAGKVPVLAHIPYSSDGNHNAIPQYNAVIDLLAASNHLPIGPDLYTYFMNNPTQLMDMIHPDPAGRIAMNKLWAQAMDGLYAP
jgi:lysophospholipase L1-like esterase